MKIVVASAPDAIDFTKRKSKLLNSAVITRVKFNPKNTKHRESAKKFFETGKWGDIRFQTEFPYLDTPTTVLHKLANHTLKINED